MGRARSAAILLTGTALAWTATAIGACGGPSASIPDGGSGADSASDTGGSDSALDAPPAPLPSALVTPDPTQTIGVVSPLLFGEGMEWTHYGQDVMVPDPTGVTSGTFRPELVSALKNMNIPVMRYPGGTLADLFQWSQAVGPMASRIPQLDQDPNADGGLPTLPPNFGPDEYAQFAALIGADMHVIVNVGTSTPSDAANWISHYVSNGVHVKYVEVGNETYQAGPGDSFPAMTPSDYATKFDQYAVAIRAVDPSIKIMAIGCMTPGWSLTAMGAITQKADYVAVHVAYFPFDVMNTAGVDTIDYYWAMMGGTEVMRTALTALETVVAAASQPPNQSAQLAMTEHASLFYPGGSDLATQTRQVQRNQTLAAAVFSASSYQTMMRDPKIGFANHINPLSPFWQASITVAPPPTTGYPAAYATQPTMSAFGYAYKLYRDSVGGTVISTQVTGTPTFNTPAAGLVPSETGIAALDALSVKMADGSIYAYVVNRDLLTDIPAQFVLPAAMSVVAIEQLAGPAYDSRNDPDNPNVVTSQSVPTPPSLGVGASNRIVETFPAHSVTRLTLK
jgi:alpha-N-arabinofuranosidase